MSENKLKNRGPIGQIQIADEVISVIAATAAMEVEGIHSVIGDTNMSIAEIFTKKNLAKGVKILVENGRTNVDVDVCMALGSKLYDVATAAQKRVKMAIETMTGINVNVVNINVVSVINERSRSEKDSVLITRDSSV